MQPTVIHVRGYHLDGYGHVNNARYLEFLEESRWDYFEQHDLLSLLGDIQMVVARVDIQYRRSATFGDKLHIHNHIKMLDARQLVLQQHIVFAHNQKTVASADVSLVAVCHKRGTTLPPSLIQQLNTLLSQSCFNT